MLAGGAAAAAHVQPSSLAQRALVQAAALHAPALADNAASSAALPLSLGSAPTQGAAAPALAGTGLSGPPAISNAAGHPADSHGTGRRGALDSCLTASGSTNALGSAAGSAAGASQHAALGRTAAARSVPAAEVAGVLGQDAGCVRRAAEGHQAAADRTALGEPCGGASAGRGSEDGCAEVPGEEQLAPDPAAAGPLSSAAGAGLEPGFEQRIAMAQRAAEGAASAAAKAAAAAAAAEQGAWRRRRQLLAEAEAASEDRARAAAAEASAAEHEVCLESIARCAGNWYRQIGIVWPPGHSELNAHVRL